jgi:proteasome lid subunit RPN8/RPN11
MTADIRDRIAHHVETAYPEEACGALFGFHRGRSAPVVTCALPLENRARCRREAFRVEPRELEQVCRVRRAGGDSLLGFYHSQPDRSPVPSFSDIELSVPGLWQVTIPVIGGRSGARRAWRATGVDECPR